MDNPVEYTIRLDPAYCAVWVEATIKGRDKNDKYCSVRWKKLNATAAIGILTEEGYEPGECMHDGGTIENSSGDVAAAWQFKDLKQEREWLELPPIDRRKLTRKRRSYQRAHFEANNPGTHVKSSEHKSTKAKPGTASSTDKPKRPSRTKKKTTTTK